MRYFIFIFWLFCYQAFAQNIWTEKQELPSLGRNASVGFSLDSLGFVVGGSTVGSVYSNQVWAYSESTDSWTEKSNFPVSIYSPTAFVLNGSAYVGNGYLQSGTSSNVFYKYNQSTDTWTTVAPFPGTARYGAAFFVIDNIGYVFGGGYLNDFWAYDPIADSWTQKATLPGVGRKHASGFAVSGKGYITCGKSGSGTVLNDTWEYNPVSDVWTATGNLSTIGRTVGVSFVLDNVGYFVTGVSSNGVNLDELWTFNESTGIWSQLNSISTSTDEKRRGAISFSIGNKGYVATGYGNTLHRNDLWEFSPAVLTPTTSEIEVTACNAYVSPDGFEIWDDSGVYLDTLLAGSINGSDSIIEVTLTIETIDPTVSIINNSELLANQLGASYQWLDCSTMLPISGAVFQDYTAVNDGAYAVIVDNGICIDTSNCVDIKGIGIESFNQQELSIYPNPIYSGFTIQYQGQIKQVEIVNSLGKRVRFKQEGELYFIDEKQGVYYVKVYFNSQKMKVVKLIKYQ